jgi:2-hydroxychromene-2-carboxylate isomerase
VGLIAVVAGVDARHKEQQHVTDPRIVTLYTDYKSPYAYLAKDPAYTLESIPGVRLDVLPYVLNIPDFLGSARLDDKGNVVEEQRSAHQWRRVKYSYMDCRRQARKRGLVIRGTVKIWDTVLGACGLLWAKRQGNAVFRGYHDRTFERFWKRELDIEDVAVVTAVLAEAGADTAGFAAYAAAEGPAEVNRIRLTAEEAGVFGTPTLVIDGELFWGSEHLPDIREMLAQG